MLKVIKTESDYDTALAAIEEFMDRDPDPGSPEADQLEVLALLIQNYEQKTTASRLPDPIDAIRFRMDQEGLTQRHLIPYIGSRSKVSEVLSGKRPLTLSMMRALHSKLGIPAKVLLQDRDEGDLDEADIDWERFPLREMIARGWIEGVANVRDQAEDALRRFFKPLGSPKKVAALYRKTHLRSARKADEYALAAWSARIAIRSLEDQPRVSYGPGTVDLEFMRSVAKQSWSDNGPALAQEFLRKHGIPLVVEAHLPRTYVDGAAILIQTDRPIIGLSLRYDRIDSFWYCLMHELAHIALHIEEGVTHFFDDLDVSGKGDQREEEADRLAGEALIPEEEWKNSPASRLRSPEAVAHLAKRLGIHPAIIAGRIRHEFKSFRKLSQLVGHNQVRKHFSESEWS